MRGVVLAAFVALSAGAGTAALAECADPAGPGVNWEGCDKQSASLPEADLSGANLRGVDFRDADLRRANLTGADLTDAKLSHSDLSRTIWADGQVCAIGSDGACD